MSLQHLAEQVRAKGRNGDTELVHFTKDELGGLNALARSMYGHDLPNNPDTGLPEASWLKKLLPTIAGAAASFFGTPALGMAVGAALGGYQAHRAGGDPLAGAIAGGMGGYGGGQLMSGLSSAGAAAGGAGMLPGGAVGVPVDATGGVETAVPPPTAPTPIPPPTPTSGVSWDNLKRGIGALGTEEGRTAFVGTAAEKGKPATGMGGSAYGALLKAATPVIVDASGEDAGKDTQGRRATPQKYEGQWVMRDGRPFFESRNVTEEKHAKGGPINTTKGVTASNVFDYLMGDAPLFKPQATPQAAPPVQAGVGGPSGTGGGGGGGGGGGALINTGGGAPASNAAPSSSVGVGAAPGTPGGIGGIGGVGSEGTSSAGDSSSADGGVGSADGSAYEQGGIVALQSGGFVFPADVVAAVGAGSSSAGLEALAKKFGAKPVAGKGHGQSDHIPAVIDGKRKARVARDEAVLDAEQVARIGGGDGKKGAQKLYDMMARVRKQSMGRTKQMRPVNLKELA
jgi:hypothetical protein